MGLGWRFRNCTARVDNLGIKKLSGLLQYQLSPTVRTIRIFNANFWPWLLNRGKGRRQTSVDENTELLVGTDTDGGPRASTVAETAPSLNPVGGDSKSKTRSDEEASPVPDAANGSPN